MLLQALGPAWGAHSLQTEKVGTTFIGAKFIFTVIQQELKKKKQIQSMYVSSGPQGSLIFEAVPFFQFNSRSLQRNILLTWKKHAPSLNLPMLLSYQQGV